MTKSFKKIILIILVPVFASLFLQSCAEDPDPTLDELIGPSGETPVITSIEPAEALAGVTEITITGNNFSPVAENNFVHFDGVKGTVRDASATQLKVISPNVISDSVKVRIAVQEVEYFSNMIVYKLTPAISEIVNSSGEPLFNANATQASHFTNIYGITVDAQENLLISVAGGEVDGIKKISSIGELTDFAPKGAEPFFAYMKLGLGDTIYAARASSRGIWQVAQNTPSVTWITEPQGTIIGDFDFDSNLNLWAIGSAIFRITRDKDVKSFSFTGTLKSIRIFEVNQSEKYLYIAGNRENIVGVWKFRIISSDSLGEPELYFDLSQYTSEALAEINAITFSADGDLIVGTTKEVDPIVIIHPDKSFEILYPGVIPSSTDIINFAWGKDKFLYFNRPGILNSDQSIKLKPGLLKLNMQKPGAPYYGRD